MKRALFLLFILTISFYHANAQSRPGSNLQLDGFKFEKRIKGPKHKNSKIIEVMVDDFDYYLAVTYKGPKSMLTLIVYELYTWEIKGTYAFKSRAELYNSYFAEDGSAFYVNTDIYKQKYTEIIFFSGETHKDSWNFHDASGFEQIGEMIAPNGEKGYVWRLRF